MSKRRTLRFKKNPSRRGRLANWWIVWRVPVLLAILSGAWWFLYRPYAYEQGWVRTADSFAVCGQSWSGADGCVVDGDTVFIANGNQRQRIRFTGFDAPELNGACAAEIAQAQKARSALHLWLQQGPVEWSGEDDPPRDKYGRELRAVRRPISNGDVEYLATYMIERGLAGESGWGTEPVNWCK